MQGNPGLFIFTYTKFSRNYFGYDYCNLYLNSLKDLLKVNFCFKLYFRVSLSTSVACQDVVRKMVPNEGFWDKNSRMQRPMSPHLTIYK